MEARDTHPSPALDRRGARRPEGGRPVLDRGVRTHRPERDRGEDRGRGLQAQAKRELKQHRAAQVLAATVCTACGTPHGEHRRDEDGGLTCPFRSPGTSFFTTAARQERYPVLHGRYRTDARVHARVEERLAGLKDGRSEVLDHNGYGRSRVLGTSTAAVRRRRRLRRRRLAREAGRS